MTDTELLTQMAKALATRETTRAWVSELSDEELARAWAECPDARALARLVAPVMETKALVRLACACLRGTLDQKKGHHRVRNAVKVLEQWTHGAASFRDVEVAATKAKDDSELSDALTAATEITDKPERVQDVLDALSLAMSNEHTVYAPGAAPVRKTRVAALGQLADVVRAATACPSRALLTK